LPCLNSLERRRRHKAADPVDGVCEICGERRCPVGHEEDTEGQATKYGSNRTCNSWGVDILVT